MLGHRRDHQSRIDAARQERTEWNLAFEALANAGTKLLQWPGSSFRT
jgi:hypothetical protein